MSPTRLILLLCLLLPAGCKSSWATYDEWFPEGASTATLVGEGVYITEVDGAIVKSGQKDSKRNGNQVLVRADRQLLRVRQPHDKGDLIWNFHFAPDPGKVYELRADPDPPGQLRISDRANGEPVPVVFD